MTNFGQTARDTAIGGFTFLLIPNPRSPLIGVSHVCTIMVENQLAESGFGANPGLPGCWMCHVFGSLAMHLSVSQLDTLGSGGQKMYASTHHPTADHDPVRASGCEEVGGTLTCFIRALPSLDAVTGFSSCK